MDENKQERIKFNWKRGLLLGIGAFFLVFAIMYGYRIYIESQFYEICYSQFGEDFIVIENNNGVYITKECKPVFLTEAEKLDYELKHKNYQG